MKTHIKTYQEIGPNPDVDLEREVFSALQAGNKLLDSLKPSEVSYLRNLNAVARHAHDERMALRTVAQEWRLEADALQRQLQDIQYHLDVVQMVSSKRFLELSKIQRRLPIWLYRWLTRDPRTRG